MGNLPFFFHKHILTVAFLLGAHLPFLKHVNDGVLRRMGRKAKYTRAALEATLRLVRAVPVPDVGGVPLSPWGHVAIRTTLMVRARNA